MVETWGTKTEAKLNSKDAVKWLSQCSGISARKAAAIKEAWDATKGGWGEGWHWALGAGHWALGMVGVRTGHWVGVRNWHWVGVQAWLAARCGHHWSSTPDRRWATRIRTF